MFMPRRKARSPGGVAGDRGVLVGDAAYFANPADVAVPFLPEALDGIRAVEASALGDGARELAQGGVPAEGFDAVQFLVGEVVLVVGQREDGFRQRKFLECLDAGEGADISDVARAGEDDGAER
jgi:hypothetical protein